MAKRLSEGLYRSNKTAQAGRRGRGLRALRNSLFRSAAALLLLFGVAACGGGGGASSGDGGGSLGNTVNGMNDLNVPGGFQYETSREVAFHFEVSRLDESPWQSAVIILSSGEPEAETEFARCVTGADGKASLTREIPAHVAEVRVHTAVVGISDMTVSVSGVGSVTCTLSVTGNSSS
jgi:hypothetical protein